MLLAEEFVPSRGYGNHAATVVGVTGALVTELSQAGLVELIGGSI